MFPLTPTFALSIVSFLSSAFTVLRTIIPLIPNAHVHPRKRSRTVIASLSSTNGAHLWLAAFDIVALATFLWEAFVETSDHNIARDPASSARLVIVLTLRQICLLVVFWMALFHARMLKPFSFGHYQWVLWIPTLFSTIVAAVLAGIMTGAGITNSFSIGVASYSGTIGVLSTLMAIYYVAAFRITRHSRKPTNELDESWEHALPCHPFPIEDVEALKDGSSWITSNSGSCRRSISSFSFDSTVHSVRPASSEDERHESDLISRHHSSWLTEPSNPLATMSEWSFQTTSRSSWMAHTATLDVHTQLHCSRACSRPTTPAFSSTQFQSVPALNPDIIKGPDIERGFATTNMGFSKSVELSWFRVVPWLLYIWIPLSFSLPRLLAVSAQSPASIVFIISVTSSAPILALNNIFFPLPISSNFFDELSNLPKPTQPGRAHRRSGSMTVVDGRRSVDVWLSSGNAFDGKNQLSRATSLLSRVPKLSVLPAKLMKDQGHQFDNSLESSSHVYEDGSATASTFVAIEFSGDRDIGRLSKSCSSLPSHLITSAPVSRQSSTGSRSSRGSRPFKSPFMTNLETIVDVSLTTPQRHARPVAMDEEANTAFSKAETHQDLITCTPVRRANGLKEIDYLSAKLLPLLVPGLCIGADIKIQKTPENIRRGLTSAMSFSSPNLASSSPVASLYTGDRLNTPATGASVSSGTARSGINTATTLDVQDEEHISRTRGPYSHFAVGPHCPGQHDVLRFPDPVAASSAYNRQSRIPRRVHRLPPTEMSAVSYPTYHDSSQTPLVSPLEDTPGSRMPSLIPVSTRVREMDAVHTTRVVADHPRRDNQGSIISGFRAPSVALPSRIPRATSDNISDTRCSTQSRFPSF